MPELGELRHFGDGARVYLPLWRGNPPTLHTAWVKWWPRDPGEFRVLEELEELPDGAVLDVAMLKQGKVIVVSQPDQGAKLDDLTMLALEKEAEAVGRERT